MDKSASGSETDESQCKARTKKCRKCKHPFTKGDKSWECPGCGENRRCLSKSVGDYPVCRMHGAGGGRPPGSKYNIAGVISKSFERIFEDNKLWEMGEQQAAMGARFEQLQLMLDDLDSHGIDVPEILRVLEKAEGFLGEKKLDTWKALQELSKIRELLDLANREYFIWNKIYENTEFMRKNADSTKKWLQANDQMIPVAELVQVITLFTKLAFVFIPNAKDRRVYADRIKAEFLPGKKEIHQIIEAKVK